MKKRQFRRFSDMYHVTYQMKDNFIVNWTEKENFTKNVFFGIFSSFTQSKVWYLSDLGKMRKRISSTLFLFVEILNPTWLYWIGGM